MFQLEPVTPEETAQPGHGLRAIELHSVMADNPGEVAEIIFRSVVGIAAAIAQKIDALVPEVQVHRICMGGPEAIAWKPQKNPASRAGAHHGITAIGEEVDWPVTRGLKSLSRRCWLSL